MDYLPDCIAYLLDRMDYLPDSIAYLLDRMDYLPDCIAYLPDRIDYLSDRTAQLFYGVQRRPTDHDQIPDTGLNSLEPFFRRHFSLQIENPG
jgi:hypothetical protein